MKSRHIIGDTCVNSGKFPKKGESIRVIERESQKKRGCTCVWERQCVRATGGDLRVSENIFVCVKECERERDSK